MRQEKGSRAEARGKGEAAEHRQQHRELPLRSSQQQHRSALHHRPTFRGDAGQIFSSPLTFRERIPPVFGPSTFGIGIGGSLYLQALKPTVLRNAQVAPSKLSAHIIAEKVAGTPRKHQDFGRQFGRNARQVFPTGGLLEASFRIVSLCTRQRTTNPTHRTVGASSIWSARASRM